MVVVGDRTAGVTLKLMMAAIPAAVRSSLTREEVDEESSVVTFDCAPKMPASPRQPRFFFFALDALEEPSPAALETLLYRPTHAVGFIPAHDGQDVSRLARVRALHARFGFPAIPLCVLLDQSERSHPPDEVARGLSLDASQTVFVEFSRHDLQSSGKAALRLVNAAYKSGLL